MGRRAQFDFDAAVDMAVDAFWRDGYEASSVKALAERMGITRSSFYNAFGDREMLLKQALARYFKRSPDDPLFAAPSDAPFKPLLSQVMRSLCRARAADPEGRGCLGVNCVAELCAGDDPLAAFLREAVARRRAHIETRLHAAKARGELAPDANPAALALSVQTLIMGLNVLSKTVRTEGELWLAAKTHLTGLGLYSKEGCDAG